MRNIILALVALCLTYPTLAQDEIKHIIEAGDNWAKLEAQYDTCREAIIYHNDISLPGIYSRFYVMLSGTTLTIPPKAACEELPTGSINHIVVSGETPMDIYAKYRQNPNGRPFFVLGDNPQILFVDSTVNPGDEVSIPDIVPFYDNSAELVVVPENKKLEPIEHTLQVGDTFKTLATAYQTCREAIIWENQMTLPHAESIAYIFEAGDTLIMPPPTACNELPFGKYTIRIEERVTQRMLIHRYRQFEPAYYELNEPQEGLLPVGTQQTLHEAEYMYIGTTELQVVGDADHIEPLPHTAQHGDSFFGLSEQYNTCIEAILYANEFKRTSRLDPTYKVKVNDTILIPPASACDTIPHDPVVVTIEEGDTMWGISYQYNTSINAIVEASIDSSESQIGTDAEAEFMKGMNHIEPGLKLVIPDGSAQYHLKYGDRLFVYDDDDTVVQPSPNLSLNEVAMCYGVEAWEISEINGLQAVRYTGGSLIIPDPKHDCILQDLGYPNGVVACYPQPLEQVANINNATPLTPIQADVDDSYCYNKKDVYETLFQDQSVIFYDSDGSRYTEGAETWGLYMSMINYCFRHDKDALRDITWDEYDTSILPPDDNIRVFALPEHITCNLEMFDDYYVYQVNTYDRLNNIARAYGTHPDLIAQANSMDNPNAIFVGQYLLIPTPTIFHVMQGLGVVFVMLVGGFGLRYLLRRRQPKVKRKPKSEASC